MKIERGDIFLIEVDRVADGQCFLCGENIYIRIASISAINGINYNAVNLATGEPWHIATTEMVKLTDAKVVVE